MRSEVKVDVREVNILSVLFGRPNCLPYISSTGGRDKECIQIASSDVLALAWESNLPFLLTAGDSMTKDSTRVPDSFSNSTGQRISPRDDRLRLLIAGGVLLVLAVTVAALRLHRLNESPRGIHYDEAAHGADALRVLQGEHAVYFPHNGETEGMIVYAVALTTTLFGPSVLSLRLPTALASAATVLALFWLGTVLFGRDTGGQSTPWRGLVVGGIAAGLLAVSDENVGIARMAFRTSFFPLFLCLSMVLLWEGWRRRSWWQFALAGVCAGLTAYTYTAARFMPILFLSFGLSLLLPFHAVTREKVRAAAPWTILFVVVTGLVAAPILVHFALHPEHFVQRTKDLSLFSPGQSPGAVLAAMAANLWNHRFAFDFWSDHLLRPWEAVFFWLGVGVAVWRWKAGYVYRLLLLWLLVMLLPSMLAETDGPNLLRMMGAVPAVYLLAAVGVWETCRFAIERLPPRLAAFGAAAAGVAVTGLILVQGAITYHNYFENWDVVGEAPWFLPQPWLDLNQALIEQTSETSTVYLVPTFFHHFLLQFEYLYQGAAAVHFFHPGAPDLAQQVRTALGATDNVSLVKVVDWEASESWLGEDSEQFAVLLSKYGRHQGSEQHPNYHVHNYTDIDLDSPWTFYDYLEPLTVDYDGGIALRGFALGQGAAQMSLQRPFELDRDRPTWMAMQWQRMPQLDKEYAFSLRLYTPEGLRAFQEDAVLRDRTHQSTVNWLQEEPVDTLRLLEFPADLPSGEYELRLVVYDFETQVPTVEIGVWEPETTLARLQLAQVR